MVPSLTSGASPDDYVFSTDFKPRKIKTTTEKDWQQIERVR